MKKAIMAAFAVFSYLASFSQVTQPNNIPAGTNYVGFDNTSMDPLPIRNEGDPRINISSNLSNKFAITELATWYGLNGLTRNNVQRTTMGLNGETDPAWSMLHLWSGLINIDTRRDWMNVGTSYIANGDVMYTGLLERPWADGDAQQTDAVIAWGCQIDEGFEDNFRIIFLEADADTTDQGTEMMRITPWGNIGMGNSFSNALQPHRRTVVHERTDSAQFRIAWGVDPNPVLGQHADFQVTNNGVLHLKNRDDGVRRPAVIGFLQGEDDDPTPFTYLDVGGVTRIRNLPDTTKTCLVLGSIADTSAGGDVRDHYLSRLDFTGNSNDYLAGDGTWQSGGLTDCRWDDDLDPFTSEDFMFAGFDPASDCYRSKLAFGTNVADAKVEIENSTDRDRVSTGLDVTVLNDVPGWEANDNDERLIGVSSYVDETSLGISGNINHIGIESVAIGGGIAVGVDARAEGGLKRSIGVYSVADLTSSTGQQDNIAYYGEVPNANGTFLYQVGGLTIFAGTTIDISDESVKTNVEQLTDASQLLANLEVKTYNLTSPENRPIAFSERTQYGLIAQQVANVIPEIVYETTVPEIRDSIGNFIEGTSVDLFGINYKALIPILIAGFQEQDALISDQISLLTAQVEANEELENQIAALSEQLEAQAAEMTEMKSQMAQVMASFQSTQSKMNNCCGTAPSEKSHSESGKNELEQNFPNPFETETTINFTLAESAQIRLEISDAQGRVLEVLVNENLSAGRYTERWDATAYAPGTYYYSLYANTELLTKKMIKK